MIGGDGDHGDHGDHGDNFQPFAQAHDVVPAGRAVSLFEVL